MVSVDWTPWLLPWGKRLSLLISAHNQTCLLGPMISESIVYFSPFVVANGVILDLEKVMGCKRIFPTSSEMCAILIQSRSQYACTKQATLTIIGWCYLFFFYTLWGGVGCNTVTLWYEIWGNIGGTGTLSVFTRRETGGTVRFEVKTGGIMVKFLVALPGSSAILESAALVLSPYSSDGTTKGVIWRMEIILLLTD